MPIRWPNESAAVLKYPVHILSRSFSTIPDSTTNRIRQMQEYFNQYAEEYYEDSDDVVEAEIVEKTKDSQTISVETLEEVVTLLNEERVADLVVLDLGVDGPGAVNTMVICSPFNSRHGYAVAETLRKAARISSDGVTKRSVRSSFGWFQVQIGTIQIHVMSRETRERFDLEGLWGVGEADSVEDEDVLIPPPRS